MLRLLHTRFLPSRFKCRKEYRVRKIVILNLILIITAGLLVLVEKVEAAFVVTPMEFHLKVANGNTGTYTFFVKNKGKETIALKVYTGDFWIEPDGKEAFLDSGKIEHSCAKWLEVSPEELELAPGESRTVKFNITAPPEKTGTYWAMIFVEQTTKPTIKTAQKGQQQFNILSFQRVGVRIFEDIPGSKTGEGKISQVNVGGNARNKLIKIDLKFENSGDTLLRCKGSVEIKDLKGETVKKATLDEFNCYPKSARIGSSTIKEELEPGQYSVLAVLDYGGEYLVAGEAIFNVNFLTGNIEVAAPYKPTVAKDKKSSPAARSNAATAVAASPSDKPVLKDNFGKQISKAFNGFFTMVKNFWGKLTYKNR